MRSPLLAVFMFIVTACSSGSAVSDEDARDFGGARALLAAQDDALRSRDRVAFQMTLDRSRTGFSTCALDNFDTTPAGVTPPARAIARFERYRGYVRAYAGYGGAAGYRATYFRRLDGAWRMSEPDPREVGERRTKTEGSITLTYWEIDEPIALATVVAAEQARQIAAQHIPRSDPVAFALYLDPTRDLFSRQCWLGGWATLDDASKPNIEIFEPSFAPDMRTLSGSSDALLRHEALHWAQGQTLRGWLAGVDWWVVEGWPDAVAGIDRRASFRASCMANAVPTRERLFRHDPLAEPPPTTQAEYEYAAANLMTLYLFDRYGEDAYWNLLRTMKQVISNDRAYQPVLGIGPDAFYDRWRADAIKRFC